MNYDRAYVTERNKLIPIAEAEANREQMVNLLPPDHEPTRIRNRINIMEINDSTPDLTDSPRTNPTESKHSPMKWHRSFILQAQECQKAGNRFEVHASATRETLKIPLIVCIPFKTYCHPAGCEHKRESVNDILRNIVKRVQKETDNPPSHYSRVHHRHSRR